MNPKIQAFKDQLIPKVPEFYYHSINKTFLFRQNRGMDGVYNWIEVGDKMASIFLTRAGYSNVKDKETGLSEVTNMLADRADDTSKSVQYAGAVAGYTKGYGRLGPISALITESPTFLVPKRGDVSIVMAIINGLFGTTQAVYVLAWLKQSLEMLLAEDRRGMQALVMVGEANCGKTFFQEHIVTPVLGGRKVNATKYVATGDTRFNGDIFKAEHLIISDPNLSTSLFSRNALGARMKDMVANETQGMECKFKDSVSLTPYSRLTFSLNSETEVVMGLPPMVESMRDKFMLFKCHSFEWPVYAISAQEKKEFAQMVRDQMPAFCWFLLHEFEIPEWMRIDPKTKKPARFGINSYHDLTILRKLTEVSPEFRLLELINECLFTPPTDAKKGKAPEELRMTARELERALKSDDSPVKHEARTLITSGKNLHNYLDRLLEHFPENIVRSRTAKRREWIFRGIDSVLDTPDPETDNSK